MRLAMLRATSLGYGLQDLGAARALGAMRAEGSREVFYKGHFGRRGRGRRSGHRALGSHVLFSKGVVVVVVSENWLEVEGGGTWGGSRTQERRRGDKGRLERSK